MPDLLALATTIPRKGDPYRYTIFIEAGIYKCRDNDTGTIVSSSTTDAKIPIQFAIDNANGSLIFIQRGVYNLSSGLDIKEKFATIEGEKTVEYYQTQGGTPNGNTILVKNYTAAASDIFIDCFGATSFWYVDLRNLVIQGDNEGIGVKFNHNVRFMHNVFIRQFRTGLYVNETVYANFFGVVVEDCVDHALFTDRCNTTYFYGGRFNSALRCVNIQDGNDMGFFGTSFEGALATGYAVYLDSVTSSIQPNDVHFIKCSFESNNDVAELIHNEGSGVRFDGCRFDNDETDYTLIHCTSTAADMEVRGCYFQANTASTTPVITLDSGSVRSKFLHNKKHRGGQILAITFTDNGTDTTCEGNEFIDDRAPYNRSYTNPYFGAGTSASVRRESMWVGINDTNCDGFLSSGCTLVGTGANFADATEGGGRSFSTGAVANNNAGLRWTTNRFRRDWGWYIILRCSFSSTSDIRVFIGTSDSNAEIAGETTLNNQSGCGVGKRTGDTNWFTYRNDGDATEDRVDTGIAFATSAVTIQLAADSTSFRSKIGSTTNTAQTTELPATTNAGFLHVEIETGAGAADKTINIFPIWATLGRVMLL